MSARRFTQASLALHVAPIAASAVRMKAVEHLDRTMTPIDGRGSPCGRCGRLTARREVYVLALKKRALACIPCNEEWIEP